jgi:hypothetical protein
LLRSIGKRRVGKVHAEISMNASEGLKGWMLLLSIFKKKLGKHLKPPDALSCQFDNWRCG